MHALLQHPIRSHHLLMLLSLVLSDSILHSISVPDEVFKAIMKKSKLS